MRALLIVVLACVSVSAENWPGFRGTAALGVAAGPLPLTWDVTSGMNVAWKTAIPGLGHSSPVIWGDRVFVTTAISRNPGMIFESKLKGERDNRQDPEQQEFRVLALDRETGRIVWNQLAHTSRPRVLRHPHNSYATPTVAADGRHVVAFFGSEGLYCFDSAGQLLWKKDLGILDQGAFDVPDYQWGTASSPILWNGKLFLQVDTQKGGFLAAFDAVSGKELWRTAREVKPSWSTPTIVQTGARAEIVANGVEFIAAYDPETGAELWRLRGTSMISVPTPFAANGLTYVFTGYYRYQRRAYAIRPGARGDITGSSEWIAWMREESPYLSTPVISGDQIYAFGNRGTGIMNVYDARTGATVYQQRIGEGTGASASLIAAGDHVYAVNEDGDVYVIRAGRSYEQTAVNRMLEPVLATPAAAGGTLFIRGATHLFAIRTKLVK